MKQFHVVYSFHAVLSRPQALAALLCGEAAGQSKVMVTYAYSG